MLNLLSYRGFWSYSEIWRGLRDSFTLPLPCNFTEQAFNQLACFLTVKFSGMFRQRQVNIWPGPAFSIQYLSSGHMASKCILLTSMASTPIRRQYDINMTSCSWWISDVLSSGWHRPSESKRKKTKMEKCFTNSIPHTVKYSPLFWV